MMVKVPQAEIVVEGSKKSSLHQGIPGTVMVLQTERRKARLTVKVSAGQQSRQCSRMRQSVLTAYDWAHALLLGRHGFWHYPHKRLRCGLSYALSFILVN